MYESGVFEQLLEGMKHLIYFLILLLVVGCNSRRKREGLNDVIADTTGKHELVLERTRAEITPGQHFGHEFKSLVWRFKQAGEWKEKIRITHSDFQSGFNHRRGIVEVHDFDPASGIAIVKVAEADAPSEAKRTRFVYSWREWSLLTNAEIRLLRTCGDPFEKY